MYDPALTTLLERCTNEELDPLVRFLTKPMTSALDRHPQYKTSFPDHRQYIDAIVKEVRLFAGHSIKHRVTGGLVGQDYNEALGEALVELGMKKGVLPDDVIQREQLIIRQCIDTNLKAQSDVTQKALIDEFYRGEWYEQGISRHRTVDAYLQRMPGGRRRISPRKLAHIARTKTRGFITGKLKGKLIKTGLKFLFKSAAGPLGWGIGVWGWLGPAWRVFIPVACYIGYLRHIKGMDGNQEPVINLRRED